MSKPNALAIALEISKRRKKKMAKGGAVNESAASEHRPMPKEEDKDMHMVSHNDAKKPLIEAQWDSRPDIKQSQKGLKTTPIKHPKMVPSSTFTSKLRDQEDDLQHLAEGGEVAPIDKDKARDFKKGFESGGPSASEMLDNIKSVFKADGGMIDEEEEHPLMKMAEGGDVEHPMSSSAKKDKDGCAIIRPDTGYGAIIRCADGGEISPEDEIMEDHDASIAAAIMAKRRMADGGMVDIDENAEEQPNQYYSRNEEILKENYDSDMDDVIEPMDSTEHDVAIDSDDHDMVSAIRRKIMAKRKA